MFSNRLFLLFFQLVVLCGFFNQPVWAIRYADFNNNGTNNVTDVQCMILVKSWIINGASPTSIPLCLAPDAKCLIDLNCDGNIDNNDVLIAIQFAFINNNFNNPTSCELLNVTSLGTIDSDLNCIVDSCEKYFANLEGDCASSTADSCQSATVACEGYSYTCNVSGTPCPYSSETPVDNNPLILPSSDPVVTPTPTSSNTNNETGDNIEGASTPLIVNQGIEGSSACSLRVFNHTQSIYWSFLPFIFSMIIMQWLRSIKFKNIH